jgi:arylsulfatase A-like enzyme
MRLTCSIILIGSSLVGAAYGDTAGAADRPNVVLISIDTLRVDHLSCYGYPAVTSPQIDQKLARRGVRFTRCFSQVPLTGPGHATMLTSLYPHEHGSIRNGVPVVDSVVTLAEILKGQGYATGAFVSGWTLRRRMTGLDRGFDVYDDAMTDRYRVVNTKRLAEDTLPHAAAWLKEKAAEGKPFFLFLHFFDPHAPYRAHPEFAEPELNPASHGRWSLEIPKRRKVKHYNQEISYTDSYVGLFLDELESMKLTERTLIMLTSDHGESLGEHGYLGHGRKVYETNLAVPLLVRYDSHLPRGKVVPGPAALLDVAPTVLELLGLSSPRQFQGMSLKPWIEGDALSDAERTLYFQTYAGAVGHVPRILRWLFRRAPSTLPIKVGMFSAPHKIIYTPQTERLEVYDLASDPWEQENVLQEFPGYQDTGQRLVQRIQSTAVASPAATLSREDEEKLRSLGYTN